MVCSSLHTQGSNFRFSRKVNGRSLSPLARGTRKMSGIVERNKRFIPACAEKSPVFLLELAGFSVHPRLRGELRGHLLRPVSPAGSSPLARGTLNKINYAHSKRRFIPACAGNSSSATSTSSRFSVHPRLRGELMLFSNKPIQFVGSSPLARGTHLNKA